MGEDGTHWFVRHLPPFGRGFINHQLCTQLAGHLSSVHLLSICRPPTHPSIICVCSHLSIRPSNICPSTHHPSIHHNLCIHPSIVHLSICLSVHPLSISVYLLSSTFYLPSIVGLISNDLSSVIDSSLLHT